MTAGRQFDRTAKFFLGGVNLYFGTTAEPRASLSPSWHVESDVTDLSAVFRSAQNGSANISNFVGVSAGVSYTGIIFANAQLEFYPVSSRSGGQAGRDPNIVIGLQGDGDGTVTKQYKRAPADFKLMPYVCLENNRNPVDADGSIQVILQSGGKAQN